MHAASRRRQPVPQWAVDRSARIPIHISAPAYLAADAALAHTASVISRVPIACEPAELAELRAHLTDLGYLPIPGRS